MRKRLSACKLVLAFVLAAIAWIPANASIYYTATTGSNSNAGTITAPFQTITSGMSHLKPGDTLYVRAGTYAESFNANIPSGTSWTAPVTIAAYPGETPVIQPGSGPASVLFFQGSQKYIIVSGFVINSINCSVDAIKITQGGGGSATYIRLQGLTIENAAQQGILTTDGGSYNQIIGCTIFNSGRGTGLALPKSDYHGMYISTDHNLIQGNICYDNPGYGIQVYESSGVLAHDNVVCGNFVYGNSTANNGSGGGMVISSGTNNQAYNNVSYGNLNGIIVDYSAVSALIANNTVYNNSEYGIYLGSGSSGAIVKNNIAYLDGSTDILNDGSSSSTLTANLSGVNPYFVNGSACDFQLTSASTAAIGKGVNVAQVTTDILGVARPAGSYDIGAYQYSQGSTSNPVPALTSISPTSATAGSAATTVTITGSNFIAGSVVQWNGTALATTYSSATKLTATIPAASLTAAGTFPITVVNAAPGGGTSSSATFTVTAVAANPVPALTSISPSSAAAGSGAATVTLTGSNFIPGSVVQWNGSALSSTCNSATQLTATIPSANLGTAGAFAVTVVNPGPGGGTSSSVTFTVTAVATNPVPTLTSLSKTSATAGSGSITVTLNGANFVSGAVAQWNGTALSTTFSSSSTLTATIPSSDLGTSGTFAVTVRNPAPGGGVSGSVSFTVNKRSTRRH